jgi:glycosyltransferase involved in cell wall biosynthesis
LDSVSIVIPVYNEIDCLPLLVDELNSFVNKNSKELSITTIFVDDGSTDGSENFLIDLPNSVHIKLTRNYGQTTALRVGIENSDSAYVALLDADLQNDPKDIPAMLNKLKLADVDAVLGWRMNREDNFNKKLSSKLASKFRRGMLKDNVIDAGCTLKVMKTKAAQTLKLYGELHRFIPTLLTEHGFTYIELPVNHRPRPLGTSKYNTGRILRGFLDVIGLWFRIRFLDRPLHFFGTLAIGMLTGSFISGMLATIFFLSGIYSYRNILNLLTLGLFLGAIQFFSLGLLLDQSSRHYLETKEKTIYRLKSNAKKN